jgi:hypothetical protein
LKEAVQLRAIMLEQQRLQTRLRSLQQRVKFSVPSQQVGCAAQCDAAALRT